MAAESQKLDKIRQIAMRAHDLPRVVAFYRDQLGIPLLFEAPGLAFFQVGEIRLMFSRPEKPEFDHPGSILYFTVGDARTAHAEYTARGVTFVDSPHVVHRTERTELWMTAFHDSEGNTLVMMSDLPRA